MFTETQIEKIIERWGQDLYSEIVQVIEIYIKKWKLSELAFFESYSMNFILFCRSEIYGECVMKICSDAQDTEFIREYNVLSEYNGRRFVKIYDSDMATGKKIVLIERVSPGTPLRDEKSIDKRLAVFSGIFVGMHIKPDNTRSYIKYVDTINYWVDTIGKRNECKDLYYHILKAKDIFLSVSASYQQDMLLHGDLHYLNILQKDNGQYVMIDPIGYIGAPVFDVPRYIVIEYHNSSIEERFDKTNYIIGYLEKSINIPNKIIRQCFYVEMAAIMCWRASLGEYDIENMIFAESIIKT